MSIQNELHAIIQLPQLVHLAETTDESVKCSIETQLILEVWNYRLLPLSVNQTEISNHILDINQIMARNTNTLENEVLQLWRNYFTQILYLSSCFEINAMNENDQIGQCRIIDMPAIDTSRHLLYTSLYIFFVTSLYYRRGSYDAAICRLREVKMNLANPQIIYPWYLDIDKYTAAGGEHKPFTQMMKELVAWPVVLDSDVTLPELKLELQAASNHPNDSMPVPPLVFADCLCFLCYHRMARPTESQSMLQELSMLVQHDNGSHICQHDKAISWQILGICQEMSGDHHGAYHSYCKALQQKYCRIAGASLIRIQNMTLLQRIP